MTDRTIQILAEALSVDGVPKGLANRPMPKNPRIYDFCIIEQDTWDISALPLGEAVKTGTAEQMMVYNGAGWVSVDQDTRKVTFHD
jgi:hypothetical protein